MALQGSIAIISPLGDYGIDQYSYELAEGLGANGMQVDVFAAHTAQPLPCPRHHRRLPVLGKAFIAGAVRELPPPGLEVAGGSSKDWARYAEYLQKRGCHVNWLSDKAPKAEPRLTMLRKARTYARKWFLDLELALYLRRNKYKVVWSQWPLNAPYGAIFLGVCRSLGMRIVHTAHNVLPHESEGDLLPEDRAFYRLADLIVVHSQYSRKELVQLCPEVAEKAVVAAHGLYTLYSSPADARERVRRALNITPDDIVFLFCGAVRPYKNIDAVLAALRDPRCARALLVVAGVESRYPKGELSSDPLGRTRQLAQRLGVADRCRLLPTHLGRTQLAELFEAGDAAVFPYIKGYGSGMLLLAMTLGKYIVATAAGGSEEYLSGYVGHTLAASAAPEDLAAAMAHSIEELSHRPFQRWEAPAELAWRAVGKRLSDHLEVLCNAAAG